MKTKRAFAFLLALMLCVSLLPVTALGEDVDSGDGGGSGVAPVNGGGSYAAGDSVTSTANEPEVGKVFNKWTADDDGVTFADAGKAQTTFPMPAQAVNVTATYEDATRTLNVTAPAFDAVAVGYTRPAAQAITIESAGNSDATIGGVALSGSGADAFALTNGTNTVTAGGTNTTYKIQPKAGLAAGTYTATVTVTYDGGATAAADVSFAVCEPVYGVKGDVQNDRLVALAVSAPGNALLIAAVYDGSGRQAGVRTVPVTDVAQAPYDTGLTVASGCTGKLMLVDKTTFAPLCAAWSSESCLPAGGSAGAAVVDYAQQFVGMPYKLGGDSLTDGTDDAGFVRLVYQHFGIDYGRLTSDGFMGVGQEVSFCSMEAGDVVVYSGHVAIYDGSGRIVEAQSTKTGITNNRSVTCSPIIGIRRLL